VRTEICTSAEFCTKNRTDLDNRALAQEKELRTVGTWRIKTALPSEENLTYCHAIQHRSQTDWAGIKSGPVW